MPKLITVDITGNFAHVYLVFRITIQSETSINSDWQEGEMVRIESGYAIQIGPIAAGTLIEYYFRGITQENTEIIENNNGANYQTVVTPEEGDQMELNPSEDISPKTPPPFGTPSPNSHLIPLPPPDEDTNEINENVNPPERAEASERSRPVHLSKVTPPTPVDEPIPEQVNIPSPTEIPSECILPPINLPAINPNAQKLASQMLEQVNYYIALHYHIPQYAQLDILAQIFNDSYPFSIFLLKTVGELKTLVPTQIPPAEIKRLIDATIQNFNAALDEAHDPRAQEYIQQCELLWSKGYYESLLEMALLGKPMSYGFLSWLVNLNLNEPIYKAILGSELSFSSGKELILNEFNKIQQQQLVDPIYSEKDREFRHLWALGNKDATQKMKELKIAMIRSDPLNPNHWLDLAGCMIALNQTFGLKPVLRITLMCGHFFEITWRLLSLLPDVKPNPHTGKITNISPVLKLASLLKRPPTSILSQEQTTLLLSAVSLELVVKTPGSPEFQSLMADLMTRFPNKFPMGTIPETFLLDTAQYEAIKMALDQIIALAKVRAKEKNMAEFLACTKLMVHINPLSENVWLDLAQAFQLNGDINMTFVILNYITLINPRSTMAMEFKIRLYNAQQMPEKAKEVMESLAKIDPTVFERLNLGNVNAFSTPSGSMESSKLSQQGQIMCTLNNLPEAERLLKQAVAQNPNDIAAKFFLALTYFKEGWIDMARELFLQIIQMPKDKLDISMQFDSFSILGDVFYYEKNFKEAKRYYGAASTVKDYDYYPYYQTGMIYAHENDWEKALKFMEKAKTLKRDPKFNAFAKQFADQKKKGPLPHPGYPKNTKRGNKVVK